MKAARASRDDITVIAPSHDGMRVGGHTPPAVPAVGTADVVEDARNPV